MPDLRQLNMRNSGKPELRCHPRLPSLTRRKEDGDARPKAGHDD
jgi:hypothetical protein